jgi:hypothetical protein
MMSWAHIVNSFGLLCDICGVIILFYFGPPAPKFTKDGLPILPFKTSDDAEHKANIGKAKKCFYFQLQDWHYCLLVLSYNLPVIFCRRSISRLLYLKHHPNLVLISLRGASLYSPWLLSPPSNFI